MTCTYRTSRPRSRSKYAPHFGNLVNELFNTAVGDVVQKSEQKYFTNPATNVVELDDRFRLEVALPGFSKKDVAITLENDLLKISSSSDTSDNTQINYRLREFNYSGFQKAYQLPDTVDGREIKASFDLGVLTIDIPKVESAIPQPPKKIKIQ